MSKIIGFFLIGISIVAGIFFVRHGVSGLHALFDQYVPIPKIRLMGQFRY